MGSDLQTSGPPPPYEGHQVANLPTMSPAMTYIVKRPARGPPPTDIVEHRISLVSPNTGLPFPMPESLWTNRDVGREEWAVFSEQLGLTTDDTAGPFSRPAGESDAARERRIKYVVEEWNAEFFKLRGFRIIPVFGEKEDIEPAKLSGKDPKGFGFKAGSSFIGVSLSPHSNGYGIKLPGGILIGVSTGKDDDQGKSK